MRPRQQKGSGGHYLIVVNKKAAEYSDRIVRRLTGAIRREGSYYSVVEPDSYTELFTAVRDYCRLGKSAKPLPPPVLKRGKVTSLVAAGGDGTVNAVANLAIEAGLPMGVLPMGQHNSIANSLCSEADIRTATQAIVRRKYRAIDVIKLGDRIVVGSLSLGLMPQLFADLKGKGMPRFAFRLTGIATKAAAAAKQIKFVVKLDAFRFDVDARMFSINLLPHTMGLRISPASMSEDGQGELVFDVNCSDKDLGQYIRDVYKGKYVYGSSVRLYRGQYISFNPGAGHTALLDGDLIELPAADYVLQVGGEKLKLYC